MKYHYPNNPTHSFSLLGKNSNESGEQINNATNPDIDEALHYAQTKVKNFLAVQYQEVISAVDNSNFQTEESRNLFTITMSTQTFVKEMNLLKSQVEVKSGDKIDGIYDKLIQAGETYPPAQPRILHKTKQVIKKSTNEVLQLTNFYNQIVTDGLLNPVKTLGDFFKKAGNSFTTAISNIF
jgi:hypothetical protein